MPSDIRHIKGVCNVGRTGNCLFLQRIQRVGLFKSILTPQVTNWHKNETAWTWSKWTRVSYQDTATIPGRSTRSRFCPVLAVIMPTDSWAVCMIYLVKVKTCRWILSLESPPQSISCLIHVMQEGCGVDLQHCVRSGFGPTLPVVVG